MGDSKRILDLCSEAIARDEWKPTDGKTFCNLAADHVATGVGCNDLRDTHGNVLLADEIVEKISTSPDWRPVTIGGTWVLANLGGLVFAMADSTRLKETHGHIATIIPSYGVYSGHWQCQVPLCMNIGRENFMGRPVSFAFREMPLFFVWKPSLAPETEA